MSVFVNIDKAKADLLHRMVKVLLCIVVLVVLVAGLRPYASYSDEWVSFNSEQSQTEFGHYGLATGALDDLLSIAIWKQSIEISLQVQLSRPPDNRFQVLAQIDSAGSEDPLIIGQWKSTIIIMSGRDYRSEFKFPRLSTDLAAHIGSYIDMVVQLTPEATSLFIDQQLITQGPPIPFSQAPNRISIGNAPDGNHGWTGKLRYFQLQSTAEESIKAQYQFGENHLPAIATSEASSSHVMVPKPGRFPDRAWIGTLRINELFHSNLQDVVINFLGFMPFGFLLCAALAFRSAHFPRALQVMLTTAIGFLLSLGIESAQTFIAGRSPHVHDLLLNTLGTAAGALSLLLLLRIWQQITVSERQQPHQASTNPENSESP